jgi:hypothetical protein
VPRVQGELERLRGQERKVQALPGNNCRGGEQATVVHLLVARILSVQWRPDLSIGTAGVCAIVADREARILHGGADPAAPRARWGGRA